MSKPKKEAKRRSGTTPGGAAASKPKSLRTKRIDPAHEPAAVPDPAPKEPVAAKLPAEPADQAPVPPVDQPMAVAPAEGPAGRQASAESGSAAMEPPAAPNAEVDAAQQRVRVQAEQLASHLRRRQKELDHREAQVNARLAAIDRDMRTARLWLAEREAEFTERNNGLDQRQKELGQRETEFEQRYSGFEKEQAELVQREKDLLCRETELKQRQAQLQKDQAEFAQREKGLQQHEAELKQQQSCFEKRQAELAQRELQRQEHAQQSKADPGPNGIELAESQIEQARVEAEQLREQIRDERSKVEQEVRQQRRKLAEEQRSAMAEIAKQQERVRQRAEQVDRSSAALEQLRAELGRMHRETLEVRLATEELWVQLAGVAPPAALTSSLSSIRSKLADHYRLANAELHEQKQELESIRSQLTQQYEKVVRQKQNYDRWAQQQRQEAEADASRLAARETQLRQLQAELDDRSLKWQAQRLDYEQQIRRLSAEHLGREAMTA